MSEIKTQPLFDFSPYRNSCEETHKLIQEFAAHDAFRSAVVEELELDDDFYRRPLRPEDLTFLTFQEPVRVETVSQLPALATHRLLLSINDLDVARLPRTDDALERERFTQFYSDRNRLLGARLRPFLEHYAFDFLGHEARPDEGTAQYLARLWALLDEEKTAWVGLFNHLAHRDYLQEGLRCILLQRWCLAPTKRIALTRAAATGYFDMLAASDWPTLKNTWPVDESLKQLAMLCGVTRREHSYWQFYLPTSLASCNLLSALSARPDCALSLYGAAFAAEAEWLAFGTAIAQACPHMVHNRSIEGHAENAAVQELASRFQRSLDSVVHRYGASGVLQVGQGFAAAQTLAACARWDLGTQLRWLSAIEHYCQFAKKIDQRIQTECPDIDRETFVEPREMCSTTHIHDDHRLVVIESGDMVFWGNLGMQLKMKPGDMVLIPQGRLHGSTVISDECTYHQPIIPDTWVKALVQAIEVE